MAVLELYLIRHGVAAERGEDYPDDSKRPLTSAGIARLRKEAKALDAMEVGFDQNKPRMSLPRPSSRNPPSRRATRWRRLVRRPV
jgi:hypothetical protein